MGKLDRRVSRRFAKGNAIPIAQLAEASKVLQNIGQVSQINELLTAAREMVPYLEETRAACAMLIQEKEDLQRRLDKSDALLMKILGNLHPGVDIKDIYRRFSERWDLEHPEPKVVANGGNGAPPPEPKSLIIQGSA